MNSTKEDALKSKYKHLFHEDFDWIECGDGWYDIISNLLRSINDLHTWSRKYPGTNGVMEIKISCIKEKFSGLRVYYDCSDNFKGEVSGIVTSAVRMAEGTCEYCGERDPKDLGLTTGWLQVCCIGCYLKESRLFPDRFARRRWIPLELKTKNFPMFFR